MKSITQPVEETNSSHNLSESPQPSYYPLTDEAAQLPYSSQRFQSKILGEHEEQKTILFAFAQGQELKSHTTPKEALLLMLEGQCSFIFPEEKTIQTLEAGQIIRIPANVPHALKALTDFKMVLLK